MSVFAQMDGLSLLKLTMALGLMGASFVFALTAARGALRRGRLIEARLASESFGDMEEGTFGSGGRLGRLGAALSLPGPEEISKVRFQLARAGWYGPDAPKTYYAVRFLAIVIPTIALIALAGPLIAAVGPKRTSSLAVLVVVAGTMGPDRVVRWRQKRRTLLCREGFPDMMDLLVASIEAGLGLDSALQRVAGEIGERHPALKANLDLMNLELRAGRSRTEAMEQFGERTDMEEARQLGVMLHQAEEMGSPLGRALRTFAEDMRVKRMLRAEEKAMALGPKLTVPLMVFIFPTIVVMLLLPAIIRLVEQFGGGA